MVEDEKTFSTHKDRAEWFGQRVCWPLRDAHPGILEWYWQERSAVKPKTRHWECAGPFNIAGRVTALAVDPANHRRVFAGAAAGGVWQTSDGGRSWRTTWPKWINANVGALAIHPRDPQVIFCATGEANQSGDSYPGSGIYKSLNGGKSWSLHADANRCELPRRIGVIAVHPFEPSGQVLYLGGVTHDETMPAGLYISTDGGLTWARENAFSSRNYFCHSIAFHPGGLVFAAIDARGAKTGIWRKTGTEWKQLELGVAGDELGRISIATAPSKPDTIYALASDWRGNGVRGVFRSRDKGDTWERIDGKPIQTETQMSYNNAIAVHPQDPDFVVYGGNNLHITRDGGATWLQATFWNAVQPSDRYVHADQHAIVMPGGKRIYAGNDGGVAMSFDEGVSWEHRDRGMVTTMFYDITVAPSNSEVFGGGSQDNGTLIAGIAGRPGDFVNVVGGDGAWMAIDAAEETHVFGTSQNIRIVRHTHRERWERKFWKNASPKTMPRAERKHAMIARMVMEPGRGPRAGRTLWVGSRRLWRTRNSGRTWRPISPFFDGSAITAIEVSPLDRELILVGTTKGGIYRTRNGGRTWSGNLAGSEIPGRLISDIETHPVKPEIVVATVAGSGRVAKMIPRIFFKIEGIPDPAEAIHHVFLSEDGGSHWRPIDPPGMPDVACQCATFETVKPYRLFVANDCGVWMTRDYKKWTDISANLPTVIISGLAYHPDGILTASTYGRGIWRLRIPSKRTV